MAFCVCGELFLFRQTSSQCESGGGWWRRGSQRREGARGFGGAVVVGWLSERVKACSQTVREVFALLFTRTGAYNLQHVINHCCVWR